jgi:hypothetical protein
VPTNDPSFVPRSHLVHEGLFGDDDDPEWKLARNLYDAVELAQSREQHELARAVRRQLKVHKNSIADLAEALGMRKENLWSKLAGTKPAMERDLIVWSWLSGEPRRTYPLDGLTVRPGMAKLPAFPVPRGRAGQR